MNNKLVNQEEYPNFFMNAFALQGSVTPRVIRKVSFIFIYHA